MSGMQVKNMLGGAAALEREAGWTATGAGPEAGENWPRRRWQDCLRIGWKLCGKGARRADFVLIAKVVGQIRERDTAIADALGWLADDFRYDEILALLPRTNRKTSD